MTGHTTVLSDILDLYTHEKQVSVGSRGRDLSAIQAVLGGRAAPSGSSRGVRGKLLVVHILNTCSMRAFIQPSEVFLCIKHFMYIVIFKGTQIEDRSPEFRCQGPTEAELGFCYSCVLLTQTVSGQLESAGQGLRDRSQLSVGDCASPCQPQALKVPRGAALWAGCLPTAPPSDSDFMIPRVTGSNFASTKKEIVIFFFCYLFKISQPGLGV